MRGIDERPHVALDPGARRGKRFRAYRDRTAANIIDRTANGISRCDTRCSMNDEKKPSSHTERTEFYCQ